MNNTNVKLNYAATLISEKRYTEARSILRGVDHPKAREWAQRIDAMRRPNWRRRIVISLLVMALLIPLGLMARRIILVNAPRSGVLTEQPQFTYLDDKCEPAADTDQAKAYYRDLKALGDALLVDPQRTAAVTRQYTRCSVQEEFMLYWALVHMQWSADFKTLSYDYTQGPQDADHAWHEYKIGWYND